MKHLLLLLLLLSFNAFSSITENAAITWVGAELREDGSAFTEKETKEYKVYYGIKTGVYDTAVSVTRPDANSIVPLGLTLTLPTGFTYYFVVTTIDIDGRESEYSQEVKIPFSSPMAPSGVIVIRIKTDTTLTIESPAN